MSWQTQMGRGVNQPGETKTKIASPTLKTKITSPTLKTKITSPTLKKKKEIKLQKIRTYIYDQVQMHPCHLTHNI
jgi:hypothetical protein